MDNVTLEKSEATSFRRSFWLQVLTSAVAGVVGCASFSWSLRGNLADEDRRISVLESKHEDDSVTNTQNMAEIRSDIRDIRDQLRQKQ